MPSQKADFNDVLFVVADLKTVWVTANVSESNIARLPKIKDGTIRLRYGVSQSRIHRPASLGR